MRGDFTRIFWGLIFVTFNISINDVDLLPDGIGYILMAWGCGGLISLSPRFGLAERSAWFMAVYAWATAAAWLFGGALPPDWGWIVGLLIALVNCGLMWHLLGGISDFALDQTRPEQARPDLAQRAEKCRIAYVVVTLAVTFLGSSADLLGLLSEQGVHQLEGSTLAIAVALLVLGLVVRVMILHLIYRVRKEMFA